MSDSQSKKFIGDAEVIRVRRRFKGKDLPKNQVLVKLRAPHQSPKWDLMQLADYLGKVVERSPPASPAT